ncbi:MAG: hypothetical protein IJX80_11200 [Clostridia bacterium]|nr:hypothetical protein [Clostridia bacterium]
MDWKKTAKKLLFPHIAVMLLLLPVSIVFLIYSMVFIGSESVFAIVSYVLAAYTLTVWCIRMPQVIRFFVNFKNENKYVRFWLDDTHLRMKFTLYGSTLWNVVYAVFQLWLGFYHATFWFTSLALYYLSLAIMRWSLARYMSKNVPGRRMYTELKRYRTCGWIFLVMNLMLSLVIFFMVYWNRTFHHHEITTITMAAYTFTSFTFAILNVIKYRKYNSPVYSASKAVSFAAACVSMLTLASTMLTTFDDGTMSLMERRIMLGSIGGAISVFVLAMAVYMIRVSTKKLKLLKAEVKEDGKQA